MNKLKPIINWIKENKKNFLLPFLLVSFFLVFQQKFTDLIIAIFVSPLLSSVETSSILIDLYFLFCTLCIFIIYIWKAKQQRKISNMFFAYIVSLAIIYVYYRFLNSEVFNFVHFKIKAISFLCLTDILLVPFVGYCFYYIIYKLCNYSLSTIQTDNLASGFYQDAAIILNESNDLLNRYGYILDIKNRILATNNMQQSFAIGIVGKWGEGKTTFLNTLEKILEGDNKVIQMRFNPWITRNVDNISAIFFSDLAKKLNEYDGSIKDKLIDYNKELLNSVNEKSFSFLKILYSFQFDEKDLHDKYESINTSIKRLNKKVIIYIDDVDRLQKEEILQVLQIIRNTANFSNTFFIVAFDREFVLQKIKDIHGPNTETYLEKIFQLEYLLPLAEDIEIYRREFYKELYNVSNDNEIDKLLNPSSTDEVLPPVSEIIHSFRDIKRYINVFLLNYLKIKENIYLPDYISICFLRLKFPEIYELLYYQKYTFLTGGNEFFGVETGELYLSLEDEKGGKQVKNTKLYSYLKDLNYSQNQIDKILSVTYAIFEIKNITGRGKRRLKNNHLSITESSCYERYFDFSMEGRLDQKEFNQIMRENEIDIQTKILEWNESRVLATDLQIKFENYYDFEDIPDLKKVIISILFFAYLPKIENNRYYNLYNTEDFYSKLGGSLKSKQLFDRMDLNQKNDFRLFIKNLFFEYAFKGRWGFLHEFALMLIEKYPDNFILSHDELKDVVAKSCIELISSTKIFNNDLMQFCAKTLQLFDDKHSGRNIITPIGDGIIIKDKLRDLILSSENLGLFLEWSILEYAMDKTFYPNNWYLVLFDSDKTFSEILQARVQNSKVKEFKDFYTNWVNAQKEPVRFTFKYLSIFR